MPLRAILFDKDGTLVDFDLTWGEAYFHTIRALTNDEVAMRRLADAIGYDIAARRVQPGSPLVAASTRDYAPLWAGALGRTPDEAFMAELDGLCANFGLAGVSPIGDPRGLLASLRAQGYRTGVLTNDTERGARVQCDKLGLTEHLDVIVGYDSGHGHKPAPDPVHAIAAIIGVSVEDIALVGDSLHDLHAARAAGAVAIGVLSGHSRADELAPHADHLVDDIMALPALLERLVA